MRMAIRGLIKSSTTWILFIVVMIIIIDFAWLDPTLRSIADDLNNWAVVIGIFALGLGAYSIIVGHTRKILKRDSMMPFSIILLLVMLIFITTGLMTGTTSVTYNTIYNTVVVPITITFYATQAFYLASASFRAFRARSWEALLLLVAAVFVMCRNAPIMGAISPLLTNTGNLVWEAGGLTGMRAILIGIGIATLAYTLRVMIGQEKTPLGGE